MGQTELSKTENANPALALTYLKKGIDSGYGTAQAYAILGLAYSQTGEKEKALNSLERALELDPQRQDARELLDRVQK
jgi:Tfp pilus assembly protein PilF